MLDDTPAKEHIISDFPSSIQVWSRDFIATIESVIVTWLESGAKEDPIEVERSFSVSATLLAGTNSPTFSYPSGEGFLFGKW